MYRPELTDGEHKFYIRLTEVEEGKVLKEFEPVILSAVRRENEARLIEDMKPFKTEV